MYRRCGVSDCLTVSYWNCMESRSRILVVQITHQLKEKEVEEVKEEERKRRGKEERKVRKEKGEKKEKRKGKGGMRRK